MMSASSVMKWIETNECAGIEERRRSTQGRSDMKDRTWAPGGDPQRRKAIGSWGGENRRMAMRSPRAIREAKKRIDDSHNLRRSIKNGG
jgi:hypothetical protein